MISLGDFGPPFCCLLFLEAIDHCHKTGKVRGLLCYNCNRLVAFLDNQDHLAKANLYLNL